MAQKISRRRLAQVVVDKLVDPKAQRHHLAKSLAAYLIEQKMTDQLEMVIGDIAKELAAREHHVYAEVRSAHALTQELQNEIAHFLQRAYRVRSVELETIHDPDLIGGLAVRTPDAQLDTSVRSKLRRLASLGE